MLRIQRKHSDESLLVVITYSFARCFATENTGTINDEIEWDNKQCLQNKFFYVMSDLISSSCALNNVIIIEKLNKNPMILFS